MNNAALTREEIRLLFDRYSEEGIIEDGFARRRYSGYRYEDLILLLSMPFIIRIPSERALGEEVADKEFIRSVCGFTTDKYGGKVPTRSTIWHFRNNYFNDVRKQLIKLLTFFAVVAQQYDISLPYIAERPRHGSFEKLTIQDCGMVDKIEVWLTDKDQSQSVNNNQQVLPFPGFKNGSSKGNRIAEVFGMPAEVRVEQDSDVYYFGFAEPPWHYTKKYMSLPKSQKLQEPSVACNVLVIRTSIDTREIALARRLGGNFGRNTYASPGGTLRKNEKPYRCASRELYEETALTVENKSQMSPVSYAVTNYEGMPKTLSLGFSVKLESLDGSLTRNDPSNLSDWTWYNIHDLPDNLFEPTEMAINDYKKGHQYTWSLINQQFREYLLQHSDTPESRLRFDE